jgi:hypothetical protein
MVSGIKTNEEVNAIYKQLRIDRKIKALILKINDKAELEVESQYPTEGFKYEDFEAGFPSDQGRFSLYPLRISSYLPEAYRQDKSFHGDAS